MVNVVILIITPIIALTVFFYSLYYRKPFTKLLPKLFIYGMFSAVPAILFEKVLLSFNAFPKILSELYQALIVAGATEEFVKRYVVITVVPIKAYCIDKNAGIVFALTAALGFASLENVLDTIFNYQSYEVGFSRGLVTVPGHILFALIMGYYLTLTRLVNDKAKQKYFFGLSLAVPIILHGIFDFVIYVKAYLILPILMAFIFLIHLFNMKKISLLYTLKTKNG